MKKYEQIVYITDRDMYASTKKLQLMSYDKALILLGRSDKAAEYLDACRGSGYTYAEYERSVGASKPSHVYNAVKADLPFMWKASMRGELTLYSTNEDKELFPILPSVDGLRNSVKADLELYKKMHAYLMHPDVVQYNPNLEFDKFIDILYAQLIQDIDKRVPCDEIPLVSWNAEEHAFRKFNPAMVQEGLTPAWDMFLERLDYPEVFLAWTWSIFDPENEGRQALWIFGEGFDGKSTAIRAISTIFGTRQTFAVTHGTYRSNWFFSEAYGKKLAVYSDCKNTRLISEARIHQLLGGDQVAVEFKGENSFMARVYSKLLIGSNFTPDVDFSKNSEATRLLYLEIKPLKNKESNTYYEKQLVEEAPAFLFKCRQMYDKYYPVFQAQDGKQYRSNELRPTDEHLESMKSSCSSKETIIVERFMAEELEFGNSKKHVLKIEDLNVALKDFLGRFYAQDKISFSLNDLVLRFRKMGLYKKQVMVNSNRFYGFAGVRLKNQIGEL
jgi:hypothetical protein